MACRVALTAAGSALCGSRERDIPAAEQVEGVATVVVEEVVDVATMVDVETVETVDGDEDVRLTEVAPGAVG